MIKNNITNQDVLQRLGTNRNPFRFTKQRHFRYYGHFKRKSGFLAEFLEGTVEGNGTEEGHATTGWATTPGGRARRRGLHKYGYVSSPVKCRRKATSGEEMILLGNQKTIL